jgi:D-serine dehydratase
VLANELVERSALRWLADELGRDSAFDFFCLVDDAGTVRRMDAILAESAPARPLAVLVEVGRQGGRAGVRSTETAREVAEAVHAAPHLELAGVEAFEGTYTSDADEEGLTRVDDLLGSVREALIGIAARGLFERGEVIVTAGGSMYFDRVIAALGDWPEVAQPVRLILRGGCYVSHDNGAYERLSPLGSRREPGESLRLHNALTLWATVLSRPEPGVVIVGAGLRDAPVDRDLPAPRAWFRDGEMVGELADAQTYRVMDQHLFIRIEPSLDVRAGDVMALDLSHPCTAFDKFRFIPLVDGQFDVRDGLITFF